MNHVEMKEIIGARRQPADCFIKWWGEDAALVDYELIDGFLAKGDKVGEVVGFELLTLEAMWQVFIGLNPDRLSREREGDGEVIRWVWQDRQGRERVSTFPYTAEGLMELMESDFID